MKHSLFRRTTSCYWNLGLYDLPRLSLTSWARTPSDSLPNLFCWSSLEFFGSSRYVTMTTRSMDLTISVIQRRFDAVASVTTVGLCNYGIVAFMASTAMLQLALTCSASRKAAFCFDFHLTWFSTVGWLASIVTTLVLFYADFGFAFVKKR